MTTVVVVYQIVSTGEVKSHTFHLSNEVEERHGGVISVDRKEEMVGRWMRMRTHRRTLHNPQELRLIMYIEFDPDMAGMVELSAGSVTVKTSGDQ
jgi:hypothetical protein